jgi:glutathione peroxidase
MPTLHDFSATSIDGEKRSLSEFSGKVCLVVNVASKCGLTPQYKQLQELYDQYHERGLEVLGFPCNQFGAQEPGSDAEVQEFCTSRYGVSFPMFSKIEVNGASRDPIYSYLTSQKTAPDGAGDIRWNFAKFLVGKDGKVTARFSPMVTPLDPILVAAIEESL